jgi:hypothetical protein
MGRDPKNTVTVRDIHNYTESERWYPSLATIATSLITPSHASFSDSTAHNHRGPFLGYAPSLTTLLTIIAQTHFFLCEQ